MSEAKLGDKNPMYGKTHTDEAKRKIGASASFRQRGKPLTESHKEALRVSFALRDSRKKTDIEKTLESIFDSYGIEYHFQPALVAGWTPDFYLPAHNCVIEADGEFWHALPGNKERDDYKDELFRRHGYAVKRFTGTQIKTGIADIWIRSLVGLR